MGVWRGRGRVVGSERDIKGRLFREDGVNSYGFSSSSPSMILNLSLLNGG